MRNIIQRGVNACSDMPSQKLSRHLSLFVQSRAHG
jgi:hypothetical protein